MKGKIRKKKVNDQGIALVTVLIVIALTMALASSLLTAAGLSYRMKIVNENSKDNFYSAESVIDEVQAVVQQIASKNLASATTSQSNYVQAVYNELTDNGTATSTIVASKLYSALAADTQTTITASNLRVGSVETDASSLTIKDVEVDYTNSDGYTDSIKTDIVVNAPSYTTSSSTAALGRYSMFVGCGTDIHGTVSQGSGNYNMYSLFEQEGDVYIGAQVDSANKQTSTALTVDKCVTVLFSGDSVVINGDIKIGGHSTVIFSGTDVEIRGKIYLTDNSNLLLGSTTNLKVTDIVVDDSSCASGTYNVMSDQVAVSAYFPFVKDRSTNKPTQQTDFDTSYWNQTASKIYYLETDGQYYPATVSGGVVKKKDGSAHDFVNFTTIPQKEMTKVTYNGTEYEFDSEFARLINVKTLLFLEGANGSEAASPKKYYVNGSVEDSSGVFKPLTPCTLSDTSTPSWKTFHYVSADGTAKDYNVEIMLGTSQGRDINDGYMNKMLILITNDKYTVKANNGGGYVGILMSAKYVSYEMYEGPITGRAILDTTDKTFLKNYMDALGNWETKRDNYSGDAADLYTYMINNLFNGGTKIFYDSDSSSASATTTVNVSGNKTLNFIELKDWTKE